MHRMLCLCLLIWRARRCWPRRGMSRPSHVLRDGPVALVLSPSLSLQLMLPMRSCGMVASDKCMLVHAS
ncbi:hypothetical protein A0H81_03371 [Grifola frondosa]|uniref:Secreted protein n=1 Tax=Grifola frondosa TaxID=5627 RepID=A0A1C7MGZ6_GRIFR|nr:hypothetical protein A0H81_03371 [Grifola frondosa]